MSLLYTVLYMGPLAPSAGQDYRRSFNIKTEFFINERNRIVCSNRYEWKRRDIKSDGLIGKMLCMSHYATNE